MFVPWDRSEAAGLAEFLVGRWPFHAGGTPAVATVLDRVAAGAYDGDEVRTFWIVDGGERVGLVRLDDLADETAMFDLRIRAAARGRGLGTAAVRWLTGYLFAELPGLVRIEATTREDNAAMRRVLVRCGYVQESRYRLAWPTADGRRLDSLGFAVLRPGLAGADTPRLPHVRLDVTDGLEPLHDSPYGTRTFTIRDPDGNEIGVVDT